MFCFEKNKKTFGFFQMKKLTDLSLFKGMHPDLYSSDGCHCNYVTDRSRRLEFATGANGDNRMLLSCQLRIRARLYPHHHHRRTRQNYYLVLITVLSGSLRYRNGSEAWIAEPGDMLITRPGDNSEYCTGPEETAEISLLLFHGTLVEPMVRYSSFSSLPILHWDQPSVPEEYTARIVEKMKDPSLPAREAESNLCYEFLQRIIMAGTLAQEQRDVQKMREFLLEKLDKPCSLEEMAGQAGCGITELTAYFRLHFGTTPHRCLVQMRMREARRLLESGLFSVKEVAVQVGYDHPANFATEFRKFHGVPPRRYRGNGSSGGK